MSARAWVQFFAIALLVAVADQASKCWAIAALTLPSEGGLVAGFSAAGSWQRFWGEVHPAAAEAQTVCSNWWHFRYVENPGAAWGFLAGSASSWRAPFFLAMSLTAMGFILQYLRNTGGHQGAVRVALALVFGGAIGNLLDRSRLGYVIDFVDWHLGDIWHWPTFNVADAAITIGVAALLLDMLREPLSRVQANAPEPPSA